MTRTQIFQCLGMTLLTLLSAPAMAQTLRVFEAQGISQDEAQSGLDLPADAGLPIGSELPETDLPPDAEAYDYGEELLRGPVHEAFAEQYNQEPVEGLIADREPPPNVPGSTSGTQTRRQQHRVDFWLLVSDDDRDDSSGSWSVATHSSRPCRWVPGYWAELDGKYQWVGGTWASPASPEIEYIAGTAGVSAGPGPVANAPSEEYRFLAAGTGIRPAMCGGLDIGRPDIRTGSGFLSDLCGHLWLCDLQRLLGLSHRVARHAVMRRFGFGDRRLSMSASGMFHGYHCLQADCRHISG
ncbi:MAG: YXWGXW repeat-containing protein [Planctomycetaceae bacterium]